MMDEIDPSLLASYQIKPWSLRYFICQAREGLALLIQEIKLGIGRKRAKGEPKRMSEHDKKQQQDHPSIFLTTSSLCPSSNSTSPFASTRRQLVVIPETVQVVDQDDDSQATSLKYGIITLSKLAHVIGLWNPGFVLDISLDLQMSKYFAISTYIQLASFFVIGLVVAKWVLEPSLMQILSKLTPSVMQVFTITVFFSELCYLVYELFCVAYIQYQRNFIQDYFLYRCTLITLPRAYQRRKIVVLLTALYVFAFTSEPLYVLLSLYYDLEQPLVWPHLSRGWFFIVKGFTIALTSISASLLSASGILIPLITCFLMLAAARHLKTTMEKQLVRFRRVVGASQHQVDRKGQPSCARLEALLNDRTRKVMDDYSCQTLTMDWPEMVDMRSTKRETHARKPGPQATPLRLTTTTTIATPTSATSSSSSSTTTTTSCRSSSSSFTSSASSSRVGSNKVTSSPAAISAGHSSQQQLSASASGLLFLYKNLLKNMSEIKQMIRLWESKFANFHLVYTLLNSLIVAQWITVAFTEARDRNLSDGDEGDRGPPSSATGSRTITAIGSYGISPFVVRIIGGVLTFIVSNIYIMLWCDCLSRRLIKIRAQLFKMNIDLTNSHVLSRGPPLELCAGGGGGGGGVAPNGMAHHNTSSAGQVLGKYAEIDQIWSLYDQVDRLASTTLFKFSSDTYYTKQCLLVIFGRSVSVLLLFIQIIEMYSYT